MKETFIKVYGKISSVEKGNIEKTVTSPVCAFSVNNGNGKKIKLILKDKLAIAIWNNFLKDKRTMDSVNSANSININKEVFVNFEAELKDYKYGEIITHNPKNLSFNFSYNFEL